MNEVTDQSVMNELTDHEREAATDTDVLIAGAGPVGLFLANECARRGLRWRLVEARAAQSQHSKALAIFPRTLEIFDMAGIAAPFLEKANRVTWVTAITSGRTLARVRFEPAASPYRFVAMVPQDLTERLLAEELPRKGGAVEYDTALVAAEQKDGRVEVTLDRKGETIRLRASYVVGCDGAHSKVRHLLNLPFAGEAYQDSFLLADVETNDALPADEMQLCPSEFGPLAIFPMSATRRRIVAMIDQVEGDAPSLELVRKLLVERGPRGIEARSLHWSSYFRIHHRQVARLREGRIFVAGDAAHIHSPFGGQGMNTGLQDAWNLVWKLDLAVRGRGSAQLLESYTAERRPVISGVIALTHAMTRALGTRSRVAMVLRNALFPLISRLPPVQRAFVRRLSQLGIDYRGSPIVEGNGERYFDDSLRGGSGIKSRFLVLTGDDLDAATVQAAKSLCNEFADIVEQHSARRPGLTLVRPDGYIAYAGNAGLGVAAVTSLRAALARMTGSP
ncbi:MAG TPA: FAD-dependent monooxygenase [Bradyrhizobium sp.]|uniref:FAD-dependent monooxygenase n=1 Tax=Bradyrhizobium sp. TaxID=376 RepID=UPI002C970D70|nr:FAD-dependent monooxygenase [Bradyrhizobium sp.]HLZ03103.1 FAD-dependent monooxygenase [Bradyrhizobium sp.]